MQTARIAIVGAGLSGLYAAFLLEQRGSRDYVLLEARDGPCGRILSVSPSARQVAAGAIDRFDLGPSWFWPGYQHQLDRLVRELGLARFEQFEAGDMLVEHSLHEPPRRMRGYVNSPPSMRLVGGMEALIDALHRRLDATRIVAGQKVRRLRSTGQHLELDSEDATSRATILCVEHVLRLCRPVWSRRAFNSRRPCLPYWRGNGGQRPPGWRPTRSISPRSGARRVCPA